MSASVYTVYTLAHTYSHSRQSLPHQHNIFPLAVKTLNYMGSSFSFHPPLTVSKNSREPSPRKLGPVRDTSFFRTSIRTQALMYSTQPKMVIMNESLHYQQPYIHQQDHTASKSTAPCSVIPRALILNHKRLFFFFLLFHQSKIPKRQVVAAMQTQIMLDMSNTSV